jgi:hypothetical protein
MNFDWKLVLALAVLVAPLSYCEYKSVQAKTDSAAKIKIACIENKVEECERF